MGKLVVSLVGFLSLCAVVLLLPSLAASQSVTLSSNQGPMGTGVTATGRGWPVGAVIHAFFNHSGLTKSCGLWLL
jgi:hypothetical protein